MTAQSRAAASELRAATTEPAPAAQPEPGAVPHAAMTELLR
ncbi:hypothetical protein [Nocardia sp. NPDC058480]